MTETFLYRSVTNPEVLVVVTLPECPVCFRKMLGITNHLQIACGNCGVLFRRVPEPIEIKVSPPGLGVVVPGKKNRHERLMDLRLKFNRLYDHSPVLLSAVDNLYFELDLLIHEVEELKGKAKS